MNRHANRHLQSSYNKYGKDKFIFEIIEYVEDINNLIDREQYYMDLFESYNAKYGYNICIKADSNLGVKRTEETKRKIGELSKKRNQGMNHPMYGKTHTEEARKNISNAQKLRQHIITPETKKKMSLAQQGEKHSGKTLTDNQVIEIKKLLYTSIKQVEIARMFNIDPRTVSYIKSGRHWSHIHIDGVKKFKMEKVGKLSEKEVIEIKKLLATTKLTYKEIGDMFNVASTSIGAIKRGLSWKHVKLEDYIDEDGNLKDVI